MNSVRWLRLFASTTLVVCPCALLVRAGEPDQDGPARLRIAVSVALEKANRALDGRMLLMFSTDSTNEPRLQINDDPKTQQIFGVNVDGLKPGQPANFDASVFGYPLKSIADIRPGYY